MDDYQQLIDMQVENFSATLEQTPNGYLLTWGDYVVNHEVRGYATLTEALTMLALVSADAQQGDRSLVSWTIDQNGGWN